MSDLPSQTSEHAFLRAGNFDIEDKNNSAGKWLIFSDENHVDQLWTTIKNHFEAGDIKNAVEVRTSTHRRINDKKKDYLISVYTADWREQEAIKECLISLRSIDILGDIVYKANKQAQACKELGVETRAWLYTSKDLEPKVLEENRFALA